MTLGESLTLTEPQLSHQSGANISCLGTSDDLTNTSGKHKLDILPGKTHTQYRWPVNIGKMFKIPDHLRNTG